VLKIANDFDGRAKVLPEPSIKFDVTEVVPIVTLSLVAVSVIELPDENVRLENVTAALAKLKRVNANRTPNPKNPNDFL
jgi:hypothetical protein